MEKCDKETLRKNRISLAKELDVDELMQVLVSKDILTDNHVERVTCQNTTFKKNVEFLNLLPTRGPDAFCAFVNALHETKQQHLAECLENTRDINITVGESAEVSLNDAETCSFRPSSFRFSSHASSNKNSPKRSMASRIPATLCDPLQLSAHVPSEHDECLTGNGFMDKSSPKSKRRCDLSAAVSDEAMEVIPSPCNALSDLESTASIESLVLDAQLSTTRCSQHQSHFTTVNPHSSTSNTASQNHKYAASNQSHVRPTDFMSSIDLADGPYRDDLTVRYANTQHLLDNEMNSYPMHRKGLALIVGVDRFEPASCLSDRLAGDVDRARLEFVFRQLGFKCYVLVDGTAQEIWSTLQKFAALEEHDSYDCMMLVIMSHGHDGVIYGRDGMPVSIEKTLQLFNNENCKSLQNKPKVFFVQACRGDKPDKGVDESDAPGKLSYSRIQPPEDDVNTNSQAGPRSKLPRPVFQNKLPTSSDLIVCYATVRGYAAMRNTKCGSWFIQALVRVLAYHACDKHLTEMMTIVNNVVKAREGYSPDSEFHRCKEMPDFSSSLCKDLHFFPGL